MANKYRKGADLERKIVREFRDNGFISARSAGSKSKIDVWAINPVTREIHLIQAKKGKSPLSNEEKSILASCDNQVFTVFAYLREE